uniref:Uncharacterized protein n=1 Tax=Arundo donax TaxID=35708 RepID=A0A0A9AAR8_ARUDO
MLKLWVQEIKDYTKDIFSIMDFTELKILTY